MKKDKMQNNKGAFITFDGVDGSGKTYLLQEFANALREEGIKVKTIVAIGQGERGKLLRQALLNRDKFGAMNPIPECTLALSMILDSYYSEALPAIENGEVVIMDRYVYSTVNYQALTFKKYVDNLDNKDLYSTANMAISGLHQLLNKVIVGVPVPKVSVICSVNKETAIANMLSGRQIDYSEFDKEAVENFDFFMKGYSKEILEDIFKDHSFRFWDNNIPYPNSVVENHIQPLVQQIKNYQFHNTGFML